MVILTNMNQMHKKSLTSNLSSFFVQNRRKRMVTAEHIMEMSLEKRKP